MPQGVPGFLLLEVFVSYEASPDVVAHAQPTPGDGLGVLAWRFIGEAQPQVTGDIGFYNHRHLLAVRGSLKIGNPEPGIVNGWHLSPAKEAGGTVSAKSEGLVGAGDLRAIKIPVTLTGSITVKIAIGAVVADEVPGLDSQIYIVF
ncbi:hypothetical protein ES703_78089 [subsurface metagenome]